MQRIAYEDLHSHDVSTCLGRLRVRSVGKGEPIVFWSSLMLDGRMWLSQARRFSQEYRVIIIDPPGHGDSEALTRAFTFAECARSVVEVLNGMNIGQAHFIGNSWGGMIGGTFASMYPDRVGAAVLMNCTASSAGWRHRVEFPLLGGVVRLFGGFYGVMISIATRAFIGPTTQRDRPWVIAYIHEALKACDVSSVSWAVESVVPNRPDQMAVFATIRTPVLVIAGEEDRTFSVKETHAMADIIPGAKWVVMEHTAHLAALESPDEVNELIHNFLKENKLLSSIPAEVS